MADNQRLLLVESELDTLFLVSQLLNSTHDLRDKLKGMKKADQAKMIGQTVAERAKSKGIETVVFDRGGYRYIGRIKALADGAREGGLQF